MPDCAFLRCTQCVHFTKIGINGLKSGDRYSLKMWFDTTLGLDGENMLNGRANEF